MEFFVYSRAYVYNIFLQLPHTLTMFNTSKPRKIDAMVIISLTLIIFLFILLSIILIKQNDQYRFYIVRLTYQRLTYLFFLCDLSVCGSFLSFQITFLIHANGFLEVCSSPRIIDSSCSFRSFFYRTVKIVRSLVATSATSKKTKA